MEDEFYHYYIQLSVETPRIQITFLPQSVECPHQTQLIQHFQDHWKQEYLTALREFHKVKGTYIYSANDKGC